MSNKSVALVTSVALAAPDPVLCVSTVCSGSLYVVSSKTLPSSVFTHPKASAVSCCCPVTWLLVPT